MDQKMLDKYSEITTNKAFADVAQTIKTPEEMQRFLAEQGLEMTIDDIVTIAKAYVDQHVKKNDGEELSEEELQIVTGGKIKWGTALVALTGIGLSVVTGNAWTAFYCTVGLFGAIKGY